MMKIFILDGTGLVGRALVQRLKNKHELYVFSRKADKFFKKKEFEGVHFVMLLYNLHGN